MVIVSHKLSVRFTVDIFPYPRYFVYCTPIQSNDN
jgi:hypothetical protein